MTGITRDDWDYCGWVGMTWVIRLIWVTGLTWVTRMTRVTRVILVLLG